MPLYLGCLNKLEYCYQNNLRYKQGLHITVGGTPTSHTDPSERHTVSKPVLDCTSRIQGARREVRLLVTASYVNYVYSLCMHRTRSYPTNED
jgi:hypothetical protein